MDDNNLLDLADQLGATLKAHGLTLTLAESCTGGMAAQMVTAIAGSSTWFDRGFVTYSNQSKQDMLNVATSTLATFGAVSEQTAIEMALGALKNSHANVAASITGIAGPDGGSVDKPVGTVCFAWVGTHLTLQTSTQHFHGDRHAIRQQAVATLLTNLLRSLA